MTSVPPTQPPAAPENDVRLTEDEWNSVSLTAHGVTGAHAHASQSLRRAVERILGDRHATLLREAAHGRAAHAPDPVCDGPTTRPLPKNPPTDTYRAAKHALNERTEA